MLRRFVLGLGLSLISGCASYGVVDNKPQSDAVYSDSYSLHTGTGQQDSGEVWLALAFSGGGTRAAAFAYGVLQELRDTKIVVNGEQRRLLDEVDLISSVSGGSFTSAYYGLHGDRIFEDYEEVFLRRDIEGYLLRSLFNPFRWLTSTGRTEMAVKYYEDVIFHGATFADMKQTSGPMVLINASDLGYGVRFSFVQEYFNLLCSDLSSYPVARAVTASSAVPVLFNPVVVENYSDCKSAIPEWLSAAEKRAANDPELEQVAEGLETYFKRERRQYAHFVDGGITDNLGLRAVYEIVEIVGGVKVFLQRMLRDPPRQLVVISLNASTDPEPKMDESRKQPSLMETIGAVSDAQLHRYNVATLDLMDDSLKRWARELSTPERPVSSSFIQLRFKDIEEPKLLQFFNAVPTSFSLTDEQVDKLIGAGRELLRRHPEFQRLLAEWGGDPGADAMSSKQR
jgi:NTE family protein